MNYDWPDDMRYRTYMTRHMPEEVHGHLRRLASEINISQEALLVHALVMGLQLVEVEILKPHRAKQERSKVQA